MTRVMPKPAKAARLQVRVRGAVQGVGFRPFIWTLAQAHNLSGWVRNDEQGVLIEIEGKSIDAFLSDLTHKAPPLSRIEQVETQPCPDAPSREGAESGFKIIESTAQDRAQTMITPDAATCSACVDDILDPTNRRCGYAFANCTHCGPRYSITHLIPYDRAQTSMSAFDMCSACQSEYDDPADRRFHAQPNACEDCGPAYSESIQQIWDWLDQGDCVAIKGLGGFHLCVDANNAKAVARLRDRKNRDAKPFAVMVANLDDARAHVDLTPEDEALLTSPAAPIVICPAKPDTGLADGLSPGLSTLGIMLAYTPFHHLLFAERPGAALVMTSANTGGEPLVRNNDEAELRLGAIADHIVTHNRDIVVRFDDSVARTIAGKPTILRRARGYVPAPIKLPISGPSVIGVGGHLKNTVCVTRGDEAFLSQHIGDLENAASYAMFIETIEHLCDLLEVTPEHVACDLHPDFMATRYAHETGLDLVEVQHHTAHIAAVIAEHHLSGPVLGLALDGYGLGEDRKSSWGGELILVDQTQTQRVGHLETLAQPGGDVAARQPWRMGAAALHKMGRGEDIAAYFETQTGGDLIATMMDQGFNAPQTSSAGRVFDAACGLLKVCETARYEGQAPMILEGLVTQPTTLHDGWAISSENTLSVLPVLEALTELDPVAGANLFHGTLASALSDWVAQTIARSGLPQLVALSGGCFQNKILGEAMVSALRQHGIRAVLPGEVPANDGGLSLGQAYMALAHLAEHE